MLTVAQRMYDQWATREPPCGPDYTWEMQPHCQVCGCWLTMEPASHNELTQQSKCGGPDPEYGTRECETWGSESYGHCTTPHDFTVYAGTELHRTCSRCGTDNIEMEF